MAIAHQGKSAGIQKRRAGIDVLGIADGGQQHKIQGINHHDQHQGQQNIDHDVEDTVKPGLIDLGADPCGSLFHKAHPPFLPQAAAGQAAGHAVHHHQHHEVDNVVEQADGRGIAVLRIQQTHLVHIGGDDLRHTQV